MKVKATYNKEIGAIMKYNSRINRRINHYTGAGIVFLFALIYWLVR